MSTDRHNKIQIDQLVDMTADQKKNIDKYRQTSTIYLTLEIQDRIWYVILC